MKTRSLIMLITGVVLVFNFNNVNAAKLVDQNFDTPGSAFVDETDGTFQLHSSAGNNHASYKSGDVYWASSIYFNNVVFTTEQTFLTFDYKFEYELNLPPSNSPLTIQDVDFSATDYFRVAALDTADYELLVQQFNPVDLTLLPPTTPAADNYGFSLPMVITANPVTGFTNVTMDLTDFILSQGLAGSPVDIYFDISNGYEFYNFGAEDELTQSEFSTTLSLDNIAVGGPVPDAVPEPAAYALFCFGVWFIVKRVKAKNI